MQIRDADQFALLAFSGLELVPPGLVLVSEWRPDSTRCGRPRPRCPATAGSPGSRNGLSAGILVLLLSIWCLRLLTGSAAGRLEPVRCHNHPAGWATPGPEIP